MRKDPATCGPRSMQRLSRSIPCRRESSWRLSMEGPQPSARRSPHVPSGVRSKKRLPRWRPLRKGRLRPRASQGSLRWMQQPLPRLPSMEPRPSRRRLRLSPRSSPPPSRRSAKATDSSSAIARARVARSASRSTGRAKFQSCAPASFACSSDGGPVGLARAGSSTRSRVDALEAPGRGPRLTREPLAREALNSLAVLFEFEVDPQGHKSQLTEWR